MKFMNRSKGHSDGMKVRGFFNVQIIEYGRGIVKDLGWKENQITNGGILNFLINGILPSAIGKTIGWMSLGTGSAPSAGDTVLEDEVSTRSAVIGSVVGGDTARFIASFPPSASLLAHPITLSNVGLFDSGVVIGSILFSGGDINPTQVWVDNQTLKVTYDIVFASA